MQNMEPLLTEDEAAPLVGISVSTLQKLRGRGYGPPFVKLGRSVRYRGEDLRKYVQDRVVYSTTMGKRISSS